MSVCGILFSQKSTANHMASSGTLRLSTSKSQRRKEQRESREHETGVGSEEWL
jgi:hypothetical protein